MEHGNFSSQSLDFHKGRLICGRLPESEFSRCSWTMANRGWSQFTGPAGSTASTEVCLPITWCTNGTHCSWVPWCMVLNPSTPTEALLFMDGCWIFVVKWCLVLLRCWRHSPYAFAFIEVLISSLSNVISFHPEGIRWALFTEWV